MTEKQKEVFDKIKERWELKGRGLYVDRKISRVVSILEEKGFVETWPSMRTNYGHEVFLAKQFR